MTRALHITQTYAAQAEAYTLETWRLTLEMTSKALAEELRIVNESLAIVNAEQAYRAKVEQGIVERLEHNELETYKEYQKAKAEEKLVAAQILPVPGTEKLTGEPPYGGKTFSEYLSDLSMKAHLAQMAEQRAQGKAVPTQLDPKPFVSDKGVRYEWGGLYFGAGRLEFKPGEEFEQDFEAYREANPNE